MRASIFVLAAMVVFVSASAGIGQNAQTTITGTIEYWENLGGYFVSGYSPGGASMIVNQNRKVLEPLRKSGKVVTINGYFRNSLPDYLYIVEINGKPYVSR